MTADMESPTTTRWVAVHGVASARALVVWGGRVFRARMDDEATADA